MPTTSVPSTSLVWTYLGVTLSDGVHGLQIACPGTINMGTANVTASGKTAYAGDNASYPVPPSLFNALLGSNGEYGFGCLLLPVGQTPTPASGSPTGDLAQYTTGVFAPGAGPVVYSAAAISALGNQNGAGPWQLWGICSDNDFGDNVGAWSVTASAIPLLASPLTVGSTDRNVGASWSRVVGASGYHLYRGGVLVATMVGEATITGTDTTGTATNGDAYTVRAYYADASESPDSNAVPVVAPVPGTPVLAGPSGCHGCQAALSWSAAANATGYVLSRRPLVGSVYQQVVSTALTAYTDTGLALRQSYLYKVVATNAWGSGASSNVVTVGTCLDAPVLTGPSACEGCQATLSWTASDGAAGYRLYRSRDFGHDAPEFVPADATDPAEPVTGDDGHAPLLIYSGALLTFTDTGVSVGRRYSYQAVAYSSCGTSPASNEVEVVPCCVRTRQVLPAGATQRQGCC